MKSFACGDVVPGCEAKWVCSSDDEILAQVGVHAAAVHGLITMPDSLVQAVSGAIQPVS